MKNMKLKLKLMIGFLTVAALAAIVGIVGIFGLTQLKEKDTQLYELNLLAISAMADFREGFQSERAQLRGMILAIGNPSEVQKTVDGFAGLEQTIADAMTAYEATIEDGSLESGYYTAKDTYLGEYGTAKKGMIDAALAGNYELAYQRLIDAGPVVAPITDGLKTSEELNNTWGRETNEENVQLARVLIIVQSAAAVCAIALAVFFAFYISGMINRPILALTGFMNQAGSLGDISLRPEDEKNIQELSLTRDEIGQCIGSTAKFVQHLHLISSELEMIAGGDLTTRVDLLSERDTLGVSLVKMVDNLNSMFAEINVSTAQVSIGSKQIADGSQSLAQGTTEQASAVEQLSSSIMEIAEKTQANAKLADRAATLANTIKDNAEKGTSQMDEMMGAVREINQASQSISKVIKVIDDIAFQTNILALNAAVEAARAGQHGKGFAVVAEEVRNLAAKSAEAAKDTGELIVNSMEKAELGARIADETAASLVEIVNGINESSQLVSEIARSSDEQAEGITQINRGIDQVAQVVQQNSATAQESAAASEEMNGQANVLESMVAQFKLKDTRMKHFQ